MTSSTWLYQAQTALTEMNIPSARLDALVLLENATGIDRAQLLAEPEREIPAAVLAPLAEQLERRLQHEPLAYILGRAEFYGRTFTVTPDVLVPRPESEMIIDVLRELTTAAPLPSGAWLADIGTGSGALAITASLETDLPVVAVDVDENCLEVATANAQNLGARQVKFSQGDLLSPLLEQPRENLYALLANLPYVPTEHPINEAATHEPALALYGGADGLDLYRTMFAQTAKLQHKPRYVLAESLPEQHAELAALAGQHAYRQLREDDFIQTFTVA